MAHREVMVRQSPNILIRAAYFLLVGWWLGGVVSGLAWLLVISIIGLPLGIYLINRLPTLMTLRLPDEHLAVQGGTIVRSTRRQLPFLVRAIYFLLVGWWLCGLWMSVAYLLMLSVIGIPLAFWMYNRVGAVTTLFRY